MNTFQESSYFLTRIIVLRVIAVVCCAAFSTALLQNLALLGSYGLIPACTNVHARATFVEEPSVFSFWSCNDESLTLLAICGLSVSILVLVTGWCNVVALAVLWLSQASLIRLHSTWYGFGWETQLIETLLWTAPALPLFSLSRFSVRPSRLAIWYQRFLLLKIMIGAGLIKWRGSECWRDYWGAPCMAVHYETQPNPHPASWLFHHTPLIVHGIETAANHVVELLCPWLLLGPRSMRMIGAVIQIAFQLTLIASGNLSFLNWLTLIPALWCFDDSSLSLLFPENTRKAAVEAAALTGRTDGVALAGKRLMQVLGWRDAEKERVEKEDAGLKPGRIAWAYSASRSLAMLLLGLIAISLNVRVVQNLLSSAQAMNASFDGWHAANTYGAFGSVHSVRTEIVFQGWPAPWTPTPANGVNDNPRELVVGFDGSVHGLDSGLVINEQDQAALAGLRSPESGDSRWVDYEFPCKPGALSRTPCLITPYHLRLDWLAWFAGTFGTYNTYPWTAALVSRLLGEGADAPPPARPGEIVHWMRSFMGTRFAVRPADLLAYDPYRGGRGMDRPVWVRVQQYEYRYTPSALHAAVLSACLFANVTCPASLHGGWAGPWPHRQSGSEGAREKTHILGVPLSEAMAIDLCMRLPNHWKWNVARRCSAIFQVAADESGPHIAVTVAGDGQVEGWVWEVGTWYTRRLLSEWLPPLTRDNESLSKFLTHHGLL